MQKLLNTLTKFSPASVKVARYGTLQSIVFIFWGEGGEGEGGGLPVQSNRGACHTCYG